MDHCNADQETLKNANLLQVFVGKKKGNTYIRLVQFSSYLDDVTVLCERKTLNT